MNSGKPAFPPGEALDRLIAGNARFRSGKMQYPGPTGYDRARLTSGQQPYAAILGCADSRVPPEIIFDARLGELFIVRIAGNIVDEAIAGSLEYAAGHLHVPLIMVLGHSDCGAVKATIENKLSAKNISAITSVIKSSLIKDDNQLSSVNSTARANAGNMVRKLRESSVLQTLVSKNELMIVAGFYDLETGAVELL
jgi:carbonic anhydrase